MTMTKEKLSNRQKLILELVLREYVTTALPVGSRALSQSYDLGVSSATVRNEMAFLEELGYLTHPHTSAGRIPTDQGYRYYVEQLMGEVTLPLTEQRMIQHQFHQVRQGMEQWIKLAAAVLAHTARSAALITAPRMVESRFKHIELIHVHGLGALLVLVTQAGVVRQEALTLMRPLSQASLSRTARRLNDNFSGLTAREINTLASQLSPFESEIVAVVQSILNELDKQGGREVYRFGASNVLSQPEFATGDLGQQFLALFERGTCLDQNLLQLLDVETSGEVRVIIGTEGLWEELLDLSFVLSRYGVNGIATGTLGVLGPTRMSYERAVSAVRYVSELLSNLIYEWHGLQD